MKVDIDGQGLAVVTRAEYLSAHLEPRLFPYRGGKNGALHLVYAIGFDQFGAPSELPPPSLKSRDVIAMYAERDGWVCHLCGGSIDREVITGKQIASPDHLIPRSQGGTDHPGNILTAHLSCNKSRRDAPLTHALVRESLTEQAVSDHRVTHDRKGREGKGVRKGREVGSCCIVSTGSATPPRHPAVPVDACVASLRAGDL